MPTPPKKPAPARKAKPKIRARVSVAEQPSDDDWLIALFASNVRQVRQHRGLSQEAMAHAGKVDRTYVSAVEAGRRNVSLRTVQGIATALNVDVRVLFTPDLDPDSELAS